MQEKIKQRLFIVGCPRSGTTLLQSILASHSQITSFPESHFFSKCIGGKLRGKLGLGWPKSKEKLYDFLEEINYEKGKILIPESSFFIGEYVEAFIDILDKVTLDSDKRIWVEKTPGHLHYIDVISKYLSEAKFIHIIRNGEDVVASMYDVTHKYPEKWDGERSINQCIKRWNKDIGISKKYFSNQNHYVLKFEKLLEDPKETTKNLCNFIEIDFEKSMLQKQKSVAKNLISKNEEWKEGVKEGIRDKPKNKFELIFSNKEQNHIKNQLLDILQELN
ncbi:sulfotransferase family protein [Halanaerobaculum tunisiense]